MELIQKYHTNGDLSLTQLSQLTGTYVNRLKRDAKKFGIKTDSKSEAQKKALRTGAIAHPTLGTVRDDETKRKIGKSKREHWKDLDQNEKQRISKIRSKLYKKQKNIPHMSPNKTAGLKKAASQGSRIELHLYDIINNEFGAIHQYEDKLGQESYHIDIFIPSLSIGIEVDGPSHYSEIWSAEKLKRTQEKDARKESIIKKVGITLIRFIADHKYSPAYAEEAGQALIESCKQIQAGKNNKRVIHVKI